MRRNGKVNHETSSTQAGGNASRHEADARQAAPRTVFFHPDCEETVARFQPSAPASDRIC
jgi:hypothetical protein